MNWKDCICEVFVPTQGKTGNVGTGFPIASERVLTAAHVLNGWDRSRPIKLSWIHSKLEPCPSKWEDAKAAHRLGGAMCQQIDVALIECNVPAEVRPILTLSEQTHALGNLEWESEGFAEAAGVYADKYGKSFAMSGKVLIKPTRDIRFELTNLHAPNAPSGWKGASGSPVVVGRTIVGVITHNAGIEDPKTLWFTPVARFIDDPKLQELCGYDERLVRRQAFLELIKKLLDRHPSARDALARPLACNATKVCIALLESDIPRMLECCQTTWDALQREQDTDGCKAISDLLNHLLPALIDHDIVKHIRSHKLDVHHAIFELPVAIRTLAGVILAGVDRKPFEPCVRRNPNEFPHGRYAIPNPAENGFDPKGEARELSFTHHLSNKIRPEMALKKVEEAWYQYHFDNYTESDDRPNERVQIAVDELEHRTKGDGKTRYFIVETVEDKAYQQKLDNFIAELKKIWKPVVFVRLDSQPGLAEEKRRYRWYRDTIPLAEPSDSSALPQEPSKERNNKP